jgi:hypothetical protein
VQPYARGLAAAAASNPSSSSPVINNNNDANNKTRANKANAKVEKVEASAVTGGHVDPGEPRFTEAAVTRLARMAADVMRPPTARALVDAAAATGWPPAVNPAALDAFAWNPSAAAEGGDAAAGRLTRAAAALHTLQGAAEAAAAARPARQQQPQQPQRRRRRGGVMGLGEGDEATTRNDSDDGSVSWVAGALAGPVAASLRRHFTGSGAAADPTRPELLFVCAAKAAGCLAPAVSAALAHATTDGGGGGTTHNNSTRDNTAAAAAAAAAARRRLTAGFTSAVAVAAADIVREHLIPACASADKAGLYMFNPIQI